MGKISRRDILAAVKELGKHRLPRVESAPVSVQALVSVKSQHHTENRVAVLQAISEQRRSILRGSIKSSRYIWTPEDSELFKRLISLQDIECSYTGDRWGELFVHWLYVERSEPRLTACEIFHLNMFRYFSVPCKMSVIHIRLACRSDTVPAPVSEFVSIMESYGCSVDLKIVPCKDNWEHDTIMEAVEYAVSTGKFIYYTHFKGVSRLKDSCTRYSGRETVHPLNVLYWCYIMYRGLFSEFTGHAAIGPIACNRINKEYLLRDLSWSTNPTYQYIGSFQGFDGVALARAFERLGLNRSSRDLMLWWGGRYTVEMFLCLVFLENEVYSIAQMETESTAYGMYVKGFCPRFRHEFTGLFSDRSNPIADSRNNSVAVCAIARNEDAYIVEWVEYYRKLGVSHIYIYDNNTCETATMSSLNKLPYVTVIPVYGEEGLRDIGYQVGAYTQAYREFGDLYGWMGFFDIDEFVVLDKRDIVEFLGNPYYEGTHVVRLHWRYYGDNGCTRYSPRPVMERFKEPAPVDVKYSNPRVDENSYVKSFVRTGYAEMQMDVHSPRFFGSVCRNSKGFFGLPTKTTEPVILDNARVNHYGTKSIEEYIWRRMPGKDKNVSPNGACNGRNAITAKDRLDWFFNVNDVTTEKLEIIGKMLPGLMYVPLKKNV